MNVKKILVRLRKVKRIFFLSQEEFDIEFNKRRIKDISFEINEIPIKERLKFIADVKDNVVSNLMKEQAEAKLKYETILELLKQ